jgi:hypothetical protein
MSGIIIAHLTAICCANVHDRKLIEIPASSVDRSYCGLAPWNVADLRNQNLVFWSETKPDQCICFDFKTIRIRPTHYTIQTYGGECHLKKWVIEGSDDGVSWTETDRRENNRDLKKEFAVKTFTVSRSGCFPRIRLRQIGPNHYGNNELALAAFELFGSVADLQ